MNYNIYKVGGAVRDELLGLKPKDLDYAVETNSYESMKQIILNLGGEIFLETPQYLCIRAKIPNLGAADFVLCRKDGEYTDFRHPEKVTIGTIYEDLSRRDFSIGAIAINVNTNETIDPYNGRKDIENKIIRCVGNPEDRFREDALRLLRAIRFSITKEFSIHNSIVECLHSKKYVDTLSNIPYDRIYDELMKCFKHSTLKTLEVLNRFYLIRNYVFDIDSKIWLKPTMELK